ncbi:hypothetical protein IAU59_005168 [Kwoniella sp. CBS 9459]
MPTPPSSTSATTSTSPSDEDPITLPGDVLLKIPLYTSDHRTLAALARTCKPLYHVSSPLLWRNLVVGPDAYIPPALLSDACSAPKVDPSSASLSEMPREEQAHGKISHGSEREESGQEEEEVQIANCDSIAQSEVIPPSLSQSPSASQTKENAVLIESNDKAKYIKKATLLRHDVVWLHRLWDLRITRDHTSSENDGHSNSDVVTEGLTLSVSHVMGLLSRAKALEIWIDPSHPFDGPHTESQSRRCPLPYIIRPRVLILRFLDIATPRVRGSDQGGIPTMNTVEDYIIYTPGRTVTAHAPDYLDSLAGMRSLRRITWLFSPSSGRAGGASHSQCRNGLDDAAPDPNTLGSTEPPSLTFCGSPPALNRPALYAYFYIAGKWLKLTNAELVVVNTDYLARQTSSSNHTSETNSDTGFMERAFRRGIEDGVHRTPDRSAAPLRTRKTALKIRFMTAEEYVALIKREAASPDPSSGHEGGSGRIDLSEILDIDEIESRRDA